MKRKKVAILLPWLKMGGTNKVAIRFMNELVQYCDVTLILSQNVGELLEEVPKDVHVIIDEMQTFRDILKKDLKHFNLPYLVKDIIYYLKVKTGHDNIDNYRYIVERHTFVTEEMFDCAISYHGQSPERLLNLVYRIHSRKKVVWIHGEMGFPEDQCRRMAKYYEKIDHFFFVSEPTKNTFIRKIPIDPNRTTVYYNRLDGTEIIEKAQETPDTTFSKDYANLLTVGRVSSEKGQDMIPQIVRNLIDKGYAVRWYIIGDGPNMERIKDLIIKESVDKNVFLLGVRNNPYPYMKACEIYIQPSYTEGYSTTICEAGILGKAIIGTKPSGGIRDQIENERSGLIVDASVEGIEKGIVQGKRDTALNLKKMGMAAEQIAQAVGETAAIVREWLSEANAVK